MLFKIYLCLLRNTLITLNFYYSLADAIFYELGLISGLNIFILSADVAIELLKQWKFIILPLNILIDSLVSYINFFRLLANY